MGTLLGKGLVSLFVAAVALGILSLWWQTYIVGAYYASAGVVPTIMGAIVPFVVLIVAVWLIIKIVKF